MLSYKVNIDQIPDQINFVEEEEKVLDYWTQIKAFETSYEMSKGKPDYSFYDGPPFATGLPHYGHILAGTIKDAVTRYAHQNGHCVKRTFGWDCHGLPVEHEIDKLHGIRGPEDVKKIGMKQYNDLCRGIVQRYASEWEVTVKRLGRWISFDNDYKTMYPWFMESVWWTFKQIYDKNLVYRSCKVMPFSTACNTPLSNFETSQNYKDVVDPSVVVRFEKTDEANVYLLAWTTTPWTLPSNLGLIVHNDLTYVRVKDDALGCHYILMECRLGMIYPENKGYSIVERFSGSVLVGMKYVPLFDYFKHYEGKGAFRVFSDPYVSQESGTGIVHSAPAFGEDDLRILQQNGVISKTGEDIPCPVDSSGKFTEPIKEFLGLHVKEADSLIIKYLKENKSLILHSQHKHSYPFCWRSDTQLIYKAIPCWFINVESLIPQLLENNSRCYWVPEHVKNKRFHNWLENARDWNISRNRYWGTPIPLWVSDDGEEVVCVGSLEELEQLSGIRVNDLHRENIDFITIPSKKGKGILRRTSEVFDCWFESGSMPISQNHYPFENQDQFKRTFPANIVAEGVDQTRGWFYTLLVISTAVFNQPPFKNLIVSGLVLAGDGQKMSKRKKNYPDPMGMIKKYGADCIRCYLIDSPVVRGDNLCFKESGLNGMLREFFIPWFNAFRFFLQNKAVYEKTTSEHFIFDKEGSKIPDSLLDRWMLSCSQSAVKNFRKEMDAYKLYNAVPILRNYVDQLTKWYIRLNRPTLRGDRGPAHQLKSLNVLFLCLFEFCHLVAPLAPFVCEYFFQHLKLYISDTSDVSWGSVHFRMLPHHQESLVNTEIERKFYRFQTVVDMARKIRERNALRMKHPLNELIIVHPMLEYLDDVKSLENFILEDLNVKTVKFSTEQSKYGLHLTVSPDYTLLGKKYKSNLKDLMQKINELTQEKLHESVKNGAIVIDEISISLNEVKISYTADQNNMLHNFDIESDQDLVVLLDTKPNSSLENEGVARDFVNRVQRLRKKAKVNPTDDISLVYSLQKLKEESYMDKLATALENNLTLIENIIKKPVIKEGTSTASLQHHNIIIEETFELHGASVKLAIYQ